MRISPLSSLVHSLEVVLEVSSSLTINTERMFTFSSPFSCPHLPNERNLIKIWIHEHKIKGRNAKHKQRVTRKIFRQLISWGEKSKTTLNRNAKLLADDNKKERVFIVFLVSVFTEKVGFSQVTSLQNTSKRTQKYTLHHLSDWNILKTAGSYFQKSAGDGARLSFHETAKR